MLLLGEGIHAKDSFRCWSSATINSISNSNNDFENIKQKPPKLLILEHLHFLHLKGALSDFIFFDFLISECLYKYIVNVCERKHDELSL